MSRMLTTDLRRALAFQPTFATAEDLIPCVRHCLTLDVRSPSEFRQGHVPGAINLPLFDDAEREQVGKKYHQHGQPDAIDLGLELVEPKLDSILSKVKRESKAFGNQQVQVYCWRGGMRSRSMAWLLAEAGLNVLALQGGYKTFRHHVLRFFEGRFPLMIVSGLTGAGKTRRLAELKSLGEQIVDLEQIANHRGSAFGGIGKGAQPTVEHFENLVFDSMQSLNLDRRIWIEDESRKIGQVVIPNGLYRHIKSSPAIFLDVSRLDRQRLLLDEYGELPANEMIDAIRRIQKRLGGQNVDSAIEAIEAGDLKAGIEIVLDYYDRSYLKAKSKIEREIFYHLKVETEKQNTLAANMIEIAEQLKI